jgi:hypothetical protein
MNSSIARRLEKAEREVAEKSALRIRTDPAARRGRILELLIKGVKRKEGTELTMDQAAARFGIK